MSNAAKNFDVLANSLSHNYFDSLKLIFWSASS